MTVKTPGDVSAVVCTLNSISGIERCLLSLRESGVGELIVVDAHSTDGTREVAERFADRVLEDPGTGLGNARNIGIAVTSRALILNMGSDNVMPPDQLQRMIDTLGFGKHQGVSAQTLVEGTDYPTRGLNAWRRGRFVPGPAAVIGTPTLFDGDLLRAHPYNPTRVFSDDSELCERWNREFAATFAISDAYVIEVGKATWEEIQLRCRMYGVSDYEVYQNGLVAGWGVARRALSLLHPTRVDVVTPLRNLSGWDRLTYAPFLVGFAALRYIAWAEKTRQRKRKKEMK